MSDLYIDQSVYSEPSAFRWTIGFLLVGAAWGLTTPFMRQAAVKREEQSKKSSAHRTFLDNPQTSFLDKKIWSLIYAVWDLIRQPAYAIPLLINLSGSIWFFLLIGHAGQFISLALVSSI